MSPKIDQIVKRGRLEVVVVVDVDEIVVPYKVGAERSEIDNQTSQTHQKDSRCARIPSFIAKQVKFDL
jgi:hypothetical protein